MRPEKKTISRRILLLMSIMVAIEIMLLVGSIFGSGVVERLNQNEADILEERVINRKNYLENEMVHNWSNVDMSVQSINETTTRLIAQGKISREQLNSGDSDICEPFMEDVSDVLVSLLRNNRVTGAFVVFNTDNLDATGSIENKSGIYIRDLDPVSGASSENRDLLIERAPACLLSTLNISTDNCWRPMYEFSKNEGYSPCFYEPYQKAYQSQEVNKNYLNYGYWSQAYKLYGDEREAISYSVPLILEDGTVYGVLGVDLTLDYLKKVMPYTELFENKLGSYVLAIKEKGSSDYRDVFVNGPVYERYGKGSDEEFYRNMQKLNLYNSNTPFFDQEWYLVGGVRTVDLFSFSKQIFGVLVMSIVLTLLAGVGGSVLISRIVSNPIATLCRNLNAMCPGKSLQLNRTGIAEIDRLSSAIEMLNQEVIDSATKFEQIINMASVQIGGFEYNSKEEVFFITKGFFQVFGLSHDPASIEEFQEAMEVFKDYIISEKNGDFLFEVPSETGNTYIKLKYTDDGIRYIGVVEDVTQAVLEKDRIKYERDHDLLTGLINRRAFYSVLHRVFEKHPEQLKIAALVMMDLDNLKNINDSYGHDWGDKYICCAADVFRKAVPEETVVSRVSGDEFYLFFYGYESKGEIRSLIDKLREDIANQKIILPNNEICSLKVSGGITWYPDDSESYEELLKFSDFAMYKTKQTVKGKMNEFDIGIYNKEAVLLQNKEELTTMLEKALVQYHFQPIVDTATGELFAYEALMRVEMPTLHTPEEVITLARLEGKLDQVEVLTWRKALEAYDNHMRMKAVPSHCKVFINSISNQVLPVEIVSELEHQFGGILNLVVMEMTENERLEATVLQHKKMMVSYWNGAIALDDYGSGYNTEKNLLSLNPEFIKIDMEIIRDIDKDLNKQKIVANITSYAHERGMKLVAEGIETKEEAKTVISMGIDYLQGYLVGKPTLHPQNIDEEVKLFLRQQ